ncbi:MAG: hypothetical protein K2X48_01675 [Chitinophagaceae bacterium]|nr:hypothetical protein [Chitinophagaceae bacterium]
MIKQLLFFFFFCFSICFSRAQQSLPVVIVKRVQVADPDISKTQTFFYKRKEEFHQVLVYDMGERTGKKAPVAFYVDFLAEREKVNGAYFVEVRWVNMVFYNAETQIKRNQTGNVQRYPRSDGSAPEIPQVQNEFKFIYPVDATLEILICKKVNDELKLVHEVSEPLKYQYETFPKNTSRTGYNSQPPIPGTPDKPVIFKEFSMTYYDFIKQTILGYFKEVK